jgi:hypothetical protein
MFAKSPSLELVESHLCTPQMALLGPPNMAKDWQDRTENPRHLKLIEIFFSIVFPQFMDLT